MMAAPLFSFGCVYTNWNGKTSLVKKDNNFFKQNNNTKVEKCIHISGKPSSVGIQIWINVYNYIIDNVKHILKHKYRAKQALKPASENLYFFLPLLFLSFYLKLSISQAPFHNQFMHSSWNRSRTCLVSFNSYQIIAENIL